VNNHKKHTKHIRAGNLVRFTSGHYVIDSNATWNDRYGRRHVGREIYLAKGDVALVLETGFNVIGKSKREYCIILLEDRKLKIDGAYWFSFEKIKQI